MRGARLTLRVDFGTDRAIGPGKVQLLEAIRDTGSISQAGRSLGMSYRRAWLLVDDMNRCFREPVVTAQPGGSQGGGAALTAFGEKVVRKYRTIESEATAAARTQLNDLEAAVRSSRRGAGKMRKTSIRASTASA
jgi:molybdate transport system regulatory protein